jgi:hypothetical protein
MKKIYGLLGLFLCTFLGTSHAQTNRLFLAGGSGNEKFNTVFQLSDSTVLIAGEAENLNWLPNGTPIITLDTIAGQAPISTSPGSLGFILHCTKDLATIVRAMRLPANTIESINKIKTTSKPGDPTGEIYFSGRRASGYFVGRLDKNFINGIPSKVEMGVNIRAGIVSTGNKHQYDGVSYHRLFQPWDVDSDGHVLAGTGEEFEFNWASLDKYNRNGKADSVEFFPAQYAKLNGGTQYPTITGRSVEVNFRTASNLPDSLWVRVSTNPDVFDSVKVVGSSGSSIVLKTYRSGGMRSQTQAEFNLIQNDENGNSGRKHFRTDDFLFDTLCEKGNCPGNGPGYTGYSLSNIWNARIGDVAIDRRNGDMYFTYTIPTQGPSQQTIPQGKATSYDLQPALVAMTKNGQIKWWARLMKETSAGNSADQITDGLAIDYLNNSLVILGRVYDTCSNNYWKGNEIALNPGENGFQNQWTGPDPKIEYSWLGKYDLNTGRIKYATYVAENAKNAGSTGSTISAPLLDGWKDPNTGNPRLSETVTPIGGRTLDVDAQGNVYIVSNTKGRAITTNNAYQKVPKPATSGNADSLPQNEYSFVRVYNTTLSGLVYSSAVSSIWNPQDSSSKSPVSLSGVLPTGNGFYLVGSHQGRNTVNEVVAGPGYINPSAWANDSLFKFSGLVGLHKFSTTNGLAKPSIISGPASHCTGETKTYSITNDAAATNGYQWIMPGINWFIVGPANGNSVQIKFTGSKGGQLRVVAKNANGVSEPSYLNIPDATNPPTVSTSGFVCSTGGSARLNALGSTPGNFRWYADSLSTFSIADSINGRLTVSNITATTRFFVSIIGSNGCETEKRGINARFGKSAPGINPLPANGPPYNALQSIPSSLPAGVTRTWTKNGTQIGIGGVIGLTGDGTYRLCFTNPCGDSCITYVINSVASQLSGLDFRIFPNPTSGNLNLGISGENKESISVEVKDLLGKGLLYKIFNRKEDSERVSLETAVLSPGIYFLNIKMKSGQKTIRFVKQ